MLTDMKRLHRCAGLPGSTVHTDGKLKTLKIKLNLPATYKTLDN